MGIETPRRARVKRHRPEVFDIEKAVELWQADKVHAAMLAKRLLDQKEVIEKYVDRNGFTDDAGHLWYELEDGRKIQHQRKAGKHLNPERTEKLLRKKKLWDECTVVVEEIDESLVLAANYSEKISDEELADLYDENVTWALQQPK